MEENSSRFPDRNVSMETVVLTIGLSPTDKRKYIQILMVIHEIFSVLLKVLFGSAGDVCINKSHDFLNQNNHEIFIVYRTKFD